MDDLQAEYDALVADTKVRPFSYPRQASISLIRWLLSQDVEKTTTELSKELAVFDRTDVQLQEKKKSMLAKTKKLKKLIEDDTHAKSEAETWIRNYGEEIDKVRVQLDKMEKSLEADESELEKVRDGLKGAPFPLFYIIVEGC